MARLKTLAPRLKEIRPRAAATPAPAAYGQGRGGRPWRRIRDQVMARDGHLCQCEDCKASKRLLVAHEVDHIVPLSQGGTDDQNNLRAINRDCHKAKTQREARGQA